MRKSFLNIIVIAIISTILYTIILTKTEGEPILKLVLSMVLLIGTLYLIVKAIFVGRRQRAEEIEESNDTKNK